MLIIIMMKFKYLATLQSVETHLSFITLDYVSLLNNNNNNNEDYLYSAQSLKRL